MKTPADILREAKALIADEAKWCQGALAKRSNVECDPFTQPYDQLCSYGAIRVITKDCWDEICEVQPWLNVAAYETLQNKKIARQKDVPFVVAVNEQLDHAAVMEMFDRAIELAEKGGWAK